MSLLSGDGNAGNRSGFCIKYRRHRICTGMYGAGNTTKIRKVDVCTRYSSMQYLIILFETEESKIKDIMERIFTQYRKEYKGTSLLPKYEYISMMKEEKKETQV